ncbi:MAG: SPASM domain-containing protein [Bacteroidota bacterium]|jgi:SPASM domain peptide maturase of grasp-with-spasm system
MSLSENTQLYNVYFSTTNLNNASHCGVINSNYFSVNIDTFMESNLFNSCLNKKIGIDENGEIKNCPTMKNSYGNIMNTDLKQVLDNASFKELFDVKKDEINDCKVCEFRYICTDCRASFIRQIDKFDKPEKCNYNPHTATWG